MRVFTPRAARRPRPLPTLALLLLPLGLPMAGCGGGDELPRKAVSGKVTFGGQPLSSGTILFEPADGQATGGGGVIVDGSYSVPRDVGLVPGAYRVSISAGADAVGDGGEAPGAPGMMTPERIPSRYNSQSELTVEVAESGRNSFDFDLEP